MITIDDLKLTIEFWKWLCGLTEDYFYSEEGIREKKFNSLACFHIKKIHYENKKAIESIIYQAIDGLNNNDKWCVDQYYRSTVVTARKGKNSYADDFYHGDYENKTVARLAALQWIFNQGARNDTI